MSFKEPAQGGLHLTLPFSESYRALRSRKPGQAFRPIFCLFIFFCKMSPTLLASFLSLRDKLRRAITWTYVLIRYAEHEVSPLVVKFRDSRPVVVCDCMFSSKKQQPARCQAQEIFHTVLPLLGIITLKQF